MASSLSTIFWAVLSVLHLPIFAIPVLYWRRRNLDPINVRRPRILIIPLVTLVIAIWHILLRALFHLSSKSWLNIIILSVLLVTSSESFFVFALSLYIAYNKMKLQIAMYQESQKSSDMESLKTFLESIRMISWLLSEKFAYAWVVGHVLLWTMIVLIYIGTRIGFPNCLTPLSDISEQAAHHVLIMVYGRSLLTVICWIVLSFKLRLMQDAFGTKSLLKKTGLIGATCLCYHFFLEKTVAEISVLRLHDLCTLVLVDAAFIISFIIPLLQTRKIANRTPSTSYSSGTSARPSDFELFLHTADGFAAFKRHLEKEFAVENLLFWKDVNLFREKCDADDAGRLSCKSIILSWAIFDKYLCSSAPLEINLPFQLSMKFRNIFANRMGGSPAITAAIFDEAANQVLQLIEVDSLPRFLRTNPPSWNQFRALCEERMVANQVDELGKARISRERTSDSCDC